MKSERDGINPAAKPSGTGCVECSAVGGWWLHLRRCVECGHIFFAGPKLHAPHSHPLDQPVPGPAEAVPSNWQTLLHE
jgi:hypothetical protein